MSCHFGCSANRLGVKAPVQLDLVIHCSALLVILFRCAGGQDSPVAQFGGGILATSVSSIVSVPVEVIRQRQMVQTACEGSYMVRSQPSILWVIEKPVDRR